MEIFFRKKEPRRVRGAGTSVIRKLVKAEKRGNVGEISFLLKEYLKSVFKIKYEITNQELIEEIRKRKMENILKNRIINFFKRTSKIDYKEEKISREEFNQLYKAAREIANGVFEMKKILRYHARKSDRDFLLKHQKGECWKCKKSFKQTGVGPVLHYKNLNAKDNRIINMVLICPNCHEKIHQTEKKKEVGKEVLEKKIKKEREEKPVEKKKLKEQKPVQKEKPKEIKSKKPSLKIRGLLRKRIVKEAEEGITYMPFSFKGPKQLIFLPDVKDIKKVNIIYPLIEPFAFANIKWIKPEKKIIYQIIEPKLSPEENNSLKKIEESLTEMIDVKISVIKNRQEAMKYLQEKIDIILKETGSKLSPEKYVKIMYYIIRDFVGLNEIEPFMYDPYIEDIGCSGVGSQLYIIHRKFGSIETNIVYKDFNVLSNFVIKLSERCGRYISYAKPLLDGTLPDGSRVQASLAKDVTTKGPTFSIRKFRKNPLSPIDMINFKTTSSNLMAYLWFLIQHNVSVLICGGVATGKTTMLNCLSMFIAPEDKIVSIEDTREINIPHENWIPSVSRAGFGVPEAGGRRYGEVSLFDLLRESFRMNPDYVIVGEVRGREAYVMFQGIASGHPSIGTIHAGSIDDVIKRLETPPIELSPSLIETLDLLIVMINAKEKGKSARRIKEIVEIQSIDKHTGRAHTIETFGWIPSTDDFKENTISSEVLRRISFEKGFSYKHIMEELEKRKRILEWMQKHDIVQYGDVCLLVNLYYKDPNTVMNWVKKDISPGKTKLKRITKKAWESVTGLKMIK